MANAFRGRWVAQNQPEAAKAATETVTVKVMFEGEMRRLPLGTPISWGALHGKLGEVYGVEAGHYKLT